MRLENEGRSFQDEARFTDAETDAMAYAQGAQAENTRRAYRFDFADFRKFCARRHVTALPASPETVAVYLRDLAEDRKFKLTTVARRLAAIADTHRSARLASPCGEWVVRKTLKRLRRECGRPANGKAPLLPSDLRKMMQVVPDSMTGLRDRAILLLGFAGALRRSELSALTLDRLALAPEGLVVTIARGKTDQDGQGRKIGIPYGQHEETCPVKAVLRWMEAARLSDGPLFRSINRHGHVGMTALTDQVVADIVKKYARSIGRKSARFSGHSLRAGLVTAAALAGVSERSIQDQTGHRSITVLRRYIRDASIFRFNAASKVGL
jgi:site-specific recombinase XerD